MILIERKKVVGWNNAIMGARNPLNSWDRMDSKTYMTEIGEACEMGPNDYKLLTKLANAGSDHGKFMRMITVYIDITAPLYWWKEFDTYKIGTVANSCSTMHKIQAKEFTLDDFSHEHLGSYSVDVLKNVIETLNQYRYLFNSEKDKVYWWQMIQLLPSSYNQKRTVMLNYEVLKNMYNARKSHKLDEWRTFCKWVELLPWSELITGNRLCSEVE